MKCFKAADKNTVFFWQAINNFPLSQSFGVYSWEGVQSSHASDNKNSCYSAACLCFSYRCIRKSALEKFIFALES